VAVVVVDALEVVDVHHQQQRGLAGAGDAVGLAGDRVLEIAPVRQARQAVAARQVAQGVDQSLQPLRAALDARGHALPGLRQQRQRQLQAQRVRGSGWQGVGLRIHVDRLLGNAQGRCGGRNIACGRVYRRACPARNREKRLISDPTPGAAPPWNS
jgi:hypothetical protein